MEKKCKPQKYRKVLNINGEKGIIYSLVENKTVVINKTKALIVVFLNWYTVKSNITFHFVIWLSGKKKTTHFCQWASPSEYLNTISTDWTYIFNRVAQYFHLNLLCLLYFWSTIDICQVSQDRSPFLLISHI